MGKSINENEFTGMWIPKELLNLKNINFQEKGVLSIIYNLKDKYGYCFASDKRFSELLDLSPRQIRNILTKLKTLTYITVLKVNGRRKLVANIKVIIGNVLPKEAEIDFQDLEIDFQNSGNVLPNIITDNNTYKNNDSNTHTPKKHTVNKHVIQANTLEEAQELWDRDHLHEKVYLMPYKGGGYFPVTREYLGEDFFTLHANKDIPKELHKMQAWLIANPERLRMNYRKYIGTWITREWK